MATPGGIEARARRTLIPAARTLVVLGWLGGCYVDEPLEAPEPAPANKTEAASAEPAPSERGVSQIVESVRQQDAEAQAKREAGRARWAQLEAEAETMTEQERTEQARQRHSDGVQAFREGNYEAARDRFREAYVFAPERHALAFNVAKAAESAGDCCTAREYYQLFLEREPDPSMFDDVERRLDQLVCVECPG